MPSFRFRTVSIGGLGLLALTGWTTTLLAHPGHGSTSAQSPAHYVVEPVHGWWIPVLIALFGGAYGVWRVRDRSFRKARQVAHSPDRNENQQRKPLK